MVKKQKPGEKPHRSGKFTECGKKGGDVPNARQVTMKKGASPLPPTQKKNRKWKRTGK